MTPTNQRAVEEVQKIKRPWFTVADDIPAGAQIMPTICRGESVLLVAHHDAPPYFLRMDGSREEIEIDHDIPTTVEFQPIRRAPGWRPISEAPRDGTHILGLFDKVGAVECWFGHDVETTTSEPEWCAVSLPSHGCGCCGSKNPEPTGWQPLPPPPGEG
jgi:hypothetical protein